MPDFIFLDVWLTGYDSRGMSGLIGDNATDVKVMLGSFFGVLCDCNKKKIYFSLDGELKKPKFDLTGNFHNSAHIKIFLNFSE